MDNNSILLIDPTFDPASASACNLLVKVGLDNFSYAIINKETKQVNAIFDEQECENGAQKFAERLKTDSYLKLPYQQVKFAIHTENTIAIPNDLFNEKDLESHSQFFTEAHAGNLYSQAQNHFGFTTIFTLPKATDETLGEFTNGRKFEQNAGLLSLAEKLEATTLVLDFTVASFNVLFIKNQQVVFQQCYEIENVEEFNYYILLIINQLNINLKETALNISGIINEGDEKYNCLLKYFSKADFIAIANDLNQEVLDDMPAHYYSSLLALDQCV
ncbi:DUF3822 family protein [Pedobacter frigiditerrae]|uniref:DUF3822 family protein n=1 Tax=Pedobacter frigiditerrae TaxID=2530452 RepID=A0A4R0MQZ6_9SPHI|nr:DUF3822 family protein [Pedobacter frigiditerrae]TCC89290.1 DUF3822 family protein [Pedobacter frigiditerrae]